MSFFQQMMLSQATAALSATIRWYGAKYFTAPELGAADVVLAALADLPERIHTTK